MKKVLASASGIIFAVFGVAVLGLLVSLTFGALGKLFPNNFSYQIWGLVLFDIAAIVWALAFVFKSGTTMQYAIAAIGFLAAFTGTLGMVAVEVMLSGQEYVVVQPWVGQFMVYGFVIVTAIHVALLYGHHFTAVEIHEKINIGIARGEVVTEAIRQATTTLEIEKSYLAQTIRVDIVNQVKRDLGLPDAMQVLDLPALPVTNTGKTKKPAFDWLSLFPLSWGRKNESKVYEQTVPAPIVRGEDTPTQSFTPSSKPPQEEPGTLPVPFQSGESG